MSGAFQLPSCPIVGRHWILLLAAWLWAALPAGAQTTYFWNTGDGTWDSNSANWDPAGPPAAGDEAILGLFTPVAMDAEVTLGLDTPALDRLDISNGVDLLTGGFDGEAVTVVVDGTGSQLVVQDGSIFSNYDGTTQVSNGGLLLVEGVSRHGGGEVTLSSGGNAQMTGGFFEIRSNTGAGFLQIDSGSEFFGWGDVYFGDTGVINNDLLLNDGTIRTARPFPDLGLVRYELIFDTDINETDSLIDLDGTSEAGTLSLAHTTTLTILGTLSDAFSSTIDLGPGSILNISQPWAIDSGAVIDVDAVQTFPLVPATFARIEAGGSFTAESGSTINVRSGRLEVDAQFAALAGSLVEVMDDSALELSATTLIYDAEALNLTHDNTTLIVNGLTSILDTSGQFDWDGTGTTAGHATTEVNEGARLEIDVGSFDTGANPYKYDGTLNVNSGTVDVRVNDDDTTPWVMDRNLNLQNTNGIAPEITGNPLEIGNGAGVLDADVNVSGTGDSVIASDVTFRSDADVEIAAGAVLDLDGDVVFDGGEFTGSGMLEGGPINLVISSTTIGQPGTHSLTFNMSGGSWLINSGQSLNLHIAALDIDNAIAATIVIGDEALLDVELPANTAWSLVNGSLQYVGDATVDTFLAGAPVEFRAPAIVSVFGSGRITARVDFAGDVTITDVGGQLELAGGTLSDPNRLSGGTIDGPGELVIGSATALVGFGDINTNVVGSASTELRADDGTLTVTGSVTGFNIVGTDDADGVLNLAATFDTSSLSDALELRGGEVTGGLIRNDGGTIRGNGRITSSSIDNFGTIEADGGTLVIDTVNPSQLDGAAPNNGQGVLLAVTGDLEVASNVTTVFNGLLEVGSTQTFTMSQPGSRFRNAPASEDDDGSGDFGQITLIRGTFVAANFEQASQLTAISISTLDVDNITFEGGSLTEIVPNPTNRLELRGNTIVESGATFAGGGTLRNLPGSSLTLLDGARLDAVHLSNDGSFEIGGSVGAATVDSYEQNPLGTWTVEIGGTAPGTQHDQLIITHDAQLDGELIVELIDLGAGLFAPSLGDTFEILVADSVSGAFQQTSLPTLSAGLFWQVITQPDTLLLAVADHIAGDYNRDGEVNAADYTVWRDSLGSTSDLAADGNLNGMIDDGDYSVWTANFGAVASSGSLAAVPEPATLLLLSIGMAGVAGIARRRRNQ